MDNSVDEKLALNIDELTVGDPGNDLVYEYLLALFEDNGGPCLEPLVPFLKGLPENVDDDSASKFLVYYFLHD
jgi:hypothetical protein